MVLFLSLKPGSLCSCSSTIISDYRKKLLSKIVWKIFQRPLIILLLLHVIHARQIWKVLSKLWSDLYVNLVVGARMDKRIDLTLHIQVKYNESLIFSGSRGLELRKNMTRTSQPIKEQGMTKSWQGGFQFREWGSRSHRNKEVRSKELF